MQRFYYLVLLFLTAGATQLLAQTCVPDETLADTAIIKPLPVTEEMPMEGISDTACVGQSYGFTFTLRTPATIEVAVLGEVPIDSITLATEGAIGNLPAGMNYNCNPPNCVFEADSIGCLFLFGTPAEGTEGTYDLELNVTVFASGIPIALSLPDPTIVPGNYFFNVRPDGFANCAPLSIRELRNDFLTVAVAPNPASEVATIQVQSRINMDTQLNLYNATGQRVASQPARIIAGESYHQVDVRSLAPGFYIFTVGEGSQAISGRLSVLR